VDAADLIGINGADWDGLDPEIFAAGYKKHFGFVIEACRAAEHFLDQLSM
jgi:hypothetical protein